MWIPYKRVWVISGVGACGRYVEKRSEDAAPGSPLDLQNETHFSLAFVNARGATLERLDSYADGRVEIKQWRHA